MPTMAELRSRSTALFTDLLAPRAVAAAPSAAATAQMLDGAADPNDPNYCDCGWPYPLLLPRGTPEGMRNRPPGSATAVPGSL